MEDGNERRVLPGPRLLCTTVCDSGLRCGEDWPKCVNIMGCIEHGCFWRRFHEIPPEKLRGLDVENCDAVD